MNETTGLITASLKLVENHLTETIKLLSLTFRKSKVLENKTHVTLENEKQIC